MSTRRRPLRRSFAFALAFGAAWACIDATDVELLEVRATGALFGVTFLDANGNGVLDVTDTPLRGVRVVLVAANSQGVVRQVTADTAGVFRIPDVPVGPYAIRLEGPVLGDSLVVLAAATTVTVEPDDTAQLSLGASYPQLSLAEVRASLPGKRVFTSGIALNPRQPNGDGRVFFQGPNEYLQATSVARAALSVGDSIRLLGRTAVSAGQPVLDAVTPFVLIPQAQFPIPVEVTTGSARSASGGALDAALVRIRDAEIKDTATVSNDFLFWAHNGGDSVQVVFRSFLSIPKTNVRPDTIVRVTEATGFLAPFDDGSGNVRWRLLVRSAGEIGYLIKSADVGVTTSFSSTTATTNDTVQIRVTVRNLGPQTATNVVVSDTIPAALTYVSSTATRGSYNPATRTWTVGNLSAGAVADTLRIRVAVTGGPGVVTNTARLLPLLREVELNSGNNVATTSPGLTIN